MADITAEFPTVGYITAEDLITLYCGEKEEAMIGFYVPQRNQYILHNNTTQISYVYDIAGEKWTKFSGLDIDEVATISGGDAVDNLNLFLTDDNQILQYPSASNCSDEAYVETTVRVNYADFLSYDLTFDGSASAEVKVFNPQFASASVSYTKTISNFTKNNLPLGYYGNKFKIKIINPTKIDNLLLKYKPRKTRK